MAIENAAKCVWSTLCWFYVSLESTCVALTTDAAVSFRKASKFETIISMFITRLNKVICKNTSLPAATGHDCHRHHHNSIRKFQRKPAKCCNIVCEALEMLQIAVMPLLSFAAYVNSFWYPSWVTSACSRSDHKHAQPDCIFMSQWRLTLELPWNDTVIPGVPISGLLVCWQC